MTVYTFEALPKYFFESSAKAEDFIDSFLEADELLEDIRTIKISAARPNLKKISIKLGKGVRGMFNLHFHESDSIVSIGERVNGRFLIKLWQDTEISIGARTTSNALEVWLDNQATVKIGNDCLIAHEVLILAGDMHGIFDINNISQINNKPANIVVGNHVWLGRRSTLTKSSGVGNGAIVAANAVITKKFDGCSIIGGNPAKVIRQGISWTRDRNCSDKESVTKFLLDNSESFKTTED